MTNLQTKVPSNQDININAGPSEDDLFKGLRHASAFILTFNSVEGLKFDSYITAMERGPRNSWRLKGFMLDPKGTVANRRWRPFFGSYAAGSRLGIIQLAD